MLLYVALCFPHHVTSLHLALLFLRNLLFQPVIRFVWGIMIDSLICSLIVAHSGLFTEVVFIVFSFYYRC